MPGVGERIEHADVGCRVSAAAAGDEADRLAADEADEAGRSVALASESAAVAGSVT